MSKVTVTSSFFLGLFTGVQIARQFPPNPTLYGGVIIGCGIVNMVSLTCCPEITKIIALLHSVPFTGGVITGLSGSHMLMVGGTTSARYFLNEGRNIIKDLVKKNW